MTSSQSPEQSEHEAGLAPVIRPSRMNGDRAAHPSGERSRCGPVGMVLGGHVVLAGPGREATVLVRVANRTELVDDYQVEVLGAASEWSTVTPDVVGLLPGEEAVVTVVLVPPGPSEEAVEEIPFSVRVSSMVPPHDSVVEEGVVRVCRVARRPRVVRGAFVLQRC